MKKIDKLLVFCNFSGKKSVEFLVSIIDPILLKTVIVL